MHGGSIRLQVLQLRIGQQSFRNGAIREAQCCSLCSNADYFAARSIHRSLHSLSTRSRRSKSTFELRSRRINAIVPKALATQLQLKRSGDADVLLSCRWEAGGADICAVLMVSASDPAEKSRWEAVYLQCI